MDKYTAYECGIQQGAFFGCGRIIVKTNRVLCGDFSCKSILCYSVFEIFHPLGFTVLKKKIKMENLQFYFI